MLFLLVPTSAFSQTPETVTGLIPSPPDGFESVTVEKFGTNYETFVDESGYLYRVYDMWSNVTITGLVNSEPRTFQQYNDDWHFELDADNNFIIINDMVEQSEYPQVTENYTIEEIGEDTFTYSTHTPYISDKHEWKPYILGEDDQVVQVQVNGGKFVFDKLQGAVTIFDDQGIIIDSDSYTVRTALLNSDVWSNLSVNDGIVTTTVVESGESVTVSFIRENTEGLFKTEYVIGEGQVKTTAYFTNYTFENNKFAFTQTLNLTDSIISLNDMEDIDLNNYVGQSFPRSVLEQNEDLILNIKDMYYNSGLGFENLWSVNVTSPTKVSLDYANVDQVQTAIGETVELDPTWVSPNSGWYTRYFIYSVSGVASTTCVTPWTVYLGNAANYLTFPSSGTTSSNCYLPVNEFNISTIPTTATITGVSMYHEVYNSSLPRNCDFVAMDATRATATSTNVINEFNTGVVMLSNDSDCASGIGSYTANFGSAGVTELTNDIANGNTHFVVGIKPSAGIIRDGNTHQQISTNQKLFVTYTSPPSTPTNVTATFNSPNVDLSWTASDGYSGYVITSDAVSSNGVNYGATSGAVGIIGNAWDFDGINDYVDVSNITNGSNGYTWSMWGKMDVIKGVELMGRSGYVNMLISDESTYGATWASIYFAGTVSPTGLDTQMSGWHHFVGVTDCVGYSQWQCPTTIYFDGTAYNPTANTGYYPTINYYIGARAAATPSLFVDGQIDEVAIYQRALTPSEVATLYNSGSGNTPDSISTSKLTHYYDFEQTGNSLTNMAVTTDPTLSYNVNRNGVTVGTPTSTTFTDSPSMGSVYNYILSATTTYGTSGNSTTQSIDLSLPDAPTGLTATFNAPNIDLSWSTPSSAGGSPITGYKIETSLDGATWSDVTATTGNVSTTYSHTNPTLGSLNYYKVSAVSVYGAGTPSNTDSDMAGVPADAPTITTAINNPNTAPLDIDISITNGASNGTGVITNYEIYRDSTLVATTGVVSSYTDTVPSGGGTFVYEAKTVTSHGTSALSPSVSQTTPTPPPAPISAPTLDIANPNPSPFDVTVTFAMPSSGGSAITSFEIFRSIDDVTFASVGTTSQLIFYDTVPSAGLYYYKFASTNLVGVGSQSPSGNITTANVPVAIVDLAASAITDTSATLTWSEPSNGGSNIVEYKIIRDGSQIATSVVPSYTDSTVLTQTSYVYGVITNNNVGDSATSNAITVLTAGVPDAPVVTVSQNSINSLDLSWTIPADYNSAITGYKIERNDGSGYVIELANTGTVGTTYNVIGLTPISEYTFRISAINAYGTGPGGVNSNWTNPTAPTGLSVIPDSTSTNLDLYWDSNVSATGYKIERETGIGNGWSVVTADTGNTNTTYQDTGLTDNIFYNYRISTVTPVGNSVPSSTYAQTTFHLPDPVVSLTADDGLAGTVALSWTAPAAPYGSILGYTIYQVTAPGTAATATATLSTTLDQISSVTITNPGALYLSAPTVTISAPGGVAPFTTATATAVITGGVVTGITVTNVGDGYNTPPTVTISVPAGNTIVGSGTVLTPVISDTLSTLTTYSLPVADPAATYSFAVAPITVHGSTILGAGIVSISPDQVFEGITINIANEVNPVQAPIIFNKTVIGNDTDLMMTYSSSLNLTCETSNPFTTGKTTYANLAETPLGNGKVTHTMTFQNYNNSIVDVFCFDQSNPTVNGQARITQNIIPLKTQMDDFSNGVFSTGSTFAAIDLMTLVVVIVGMIGFNRKNPAVGLALMAGILGILSIFQIITMTTTAIGGFILIVFLAIIMGLKNR